MSIHRRNLPVEDKRPKVPDGGGSGVSAQRDRVPHDKIPLQHHRPEWRRLASACSGTRCRTCLPTATVAHVQIHAWMARALTACRGLRQEVHREASARIRKDLHGDGILDGSRLRPWFRAIAERLARVIILNRSWESALTDSVLQQTPSEPQAERGRVLGPAVPHPARADGGKRSYRPVPGRHRRSQ